MLVLCTLQFADGAKSSNKKTPVAQTLLQIDSFCGYAGRSYRCTVIPDASRQREMVQNFYNHNRTAVKSAVLNLIIKALCMDLNWPYDLTGSSTTVCIMSLFQSLSYFSCCNL